MSIQESKFFQQLSKNDLNFGEVKYSRLLMGLSILLVLVLTMLVPHDQRRPAVAGLQT